MSVLALDLEPQPQPEDEVTLSEEEDARLNQQFLEAVDELSSSEVEVSPTQDVDLERLQFRMKQMALLFGIRPKKMSGGDLLFDNLKKLGASTRAVLQLLLDIPGPIEWAGLDLVPKLRDKDALLRMDGPFGVTAYRSDLVPGYLVSRGLQAPLETGLQELRAQTPLLEKDPCAAQYLHVGAKAHADRDQQFLKGLGDELPMLFPGSNVSITHSVKNFDGMIGFSDMAFDGDGFFHSGSFHEGLVKLQAIVSGSHDRLRAEEGNVIWKPWAICSPTTQRINGRTVASPIRVHRATLFPLPLDEPEPATQHLLDVMSYFDLRIEQVEAALRLALDPPLGPVPPPGKKGKWSPRVKRLERFI